MFDPHGRRQVEKWFLAAALAFLALLAATGIGTAAVKSYLGPANSGDRTEIRVEIPAGSSTRQVAETLRGKGLIKNSLVFRIYAQLNGQEGKLRSGEYLLRRDMPVADILGVLVRGDVITYPFTVPEGYTVLQIARLVDAKGIAHEQEFLAAARRARARLEFIPADDRLLQPLEGYLFPDTYRVPKGVSADEVVDMMIRRFQSVFTPEMAERAADLGLSVHEAVTLASIVEAEAVVDDERPVIAAVYHNRLRIKMKLDADPTVRYVLPNPGPIVTYEDLEVNSPYNTYRNNGLPPGPINNPGLASLKAALFPANVNYLYFVARKDGRHEFSRTYREHLLARARYQG